MLFRGAVSICSFLFLVCPARSQGLPATAIAQKDPQAVSILNQTLATTGGAAAFGSIQDYTGLGTVTYFWTGQTTQAVATVRGMGIANFRLDAAFPNGTRIFAASYYSGLVITPEGARQLSSGPNLLTAGSLTLP